MPTYLIGIDVSTTATKALLIDASGEVVSAASTPYAFETPRPLWAEQDASLFWEGTVNSLCTLLQQTGVPAGQIAAVGLTGQMHGLTLLDAEGAPLRPTILWNDGRTAAECDEIRSVLGREHLIEICGNDALTGFTAPKFLWVRKNEPQIYARARHALLPKDYVRYKLTGGFATDCADGAGTILFDLKTRTWSAEILDALQIPREWLPQVCEGPQVTGTITAQAAALTGLLEGTPVAAGGGDQAAQAVGVGAVRPGIAALTLGTSGVVFATTPQAFIEPQGRLHAFCHAVPGRWHLMGVMLSAAGSLRWYRDTLAPGQDFDALLAPAADIPAGCEGLLFLPYLTGERTPHPDPLARGAFVGLTLRHTQAHLTRAVLEGVAFGLRDSFELMRSAGLTSIEQVRISGGGAKSPLWRQILANVLGAELVTVNTSEGAAYGAALLAGVGAGVWPDVDAACAAGVRVTGSTCPQPGGPEGYAQPYGLYRQLYPALEATFHQLT
jgi:xylulokinase